MQDKITVEPKSWYLKIVEAHVVRTSGVVLHKAQDASTLLGPVSAALGHGQEELSHCGDHGLSRNHKGEFIPCLG